MSMRAKLFCKHGELKGKVFEIAEEATIGRSRNNTIALGPAAVSSRHARIFLDRQRDCYYLEDLDSLNGTELDRVQVTHPERLGHLHVVTFAGDIDFIFQDLELCSRRHPDPSDSDEEGVPSTTLAEEAPPAIPGPVRKKVVPPSGRTMIDDEPPGLPTGLAQDAPQSGPGKVRPGKARPGEKTAIEGEAVSLPGFLASQETVSQEKPRRDRPGRDRPGRDRPQEPATVQTQRRERATFYLEFRDVGGPPRRLRLKEGENQVGRAKRCEVRIDRVQISRLHAVLTVDRDKVTLRDEGSRNHSFVDDRRLEAQVAVEVSPDTKLRFGDVEARLVRG